MVMRIIARSTLTGFIKSREGRPDHQAVKSALEAWFAEVKTARWRTMAAVKAQYATASVVTSDRIVFNIKGNDYRLVAAVNFKRSIVFIKWIGSHAAYDRIDVTKVQYDDRH
jgi:mRNA interferase HigB